MSDAAKQRDAEARQVRLNRLYRLGHLAVMVAVALAITGFLIGTRQNTAAPAVGPERHVTPSEAHREAPRYGDIAEEPFRADPSWQNHLDKLQSERPGLWESVTLDPEARAVSLEARAENRAYFGAPPTVPHRIDQMTAASCVSCHSPQGTRVGQKVASAMPHPMYASCTQCHVEARNAAVLPSDEPAGNVFRGLEAPGGGTRAWEGAPPTMPHAIHMHENCNSCHGVNGREGLRTSHPWRANCTQCHAPDAALDQMPGGLRWADRP